MILGASCPVFESKTILDRKNDLTTWFQMFRNDLEEINIWSITLDISLSIFKNTDQCDVIILFGKVFLDILKIPHEDLKVAKILVSVGIDQASFA